MALVGFCGSRYVHWSWDKLIARVVNGVARNGCGVAVTGATGASWAVLRTCFTMGWGFRVPALQVFTAFDRLDHGKWEYSAKDLLQKVARAAEAPGNANGAHRIKINWLAGGDASLPLERRLKTRSAAMVAAVQASGEGRGVVAFVTDESDKSSEAWYAVKLAHQSGIPVVVFGLGYAVDDFPSLGEGRWVVAGSGVWASAWRWVERAASLDGEQTRHIFVPPSRWREGRTDPGEEEPNPIFRVLRWKTRRSSRKRVNLDFPLMRNLRRWLYQQD